MRLSWLGGLAAMALPAVCQAHSHVSFGFSLGLGVSPAYCYPRYYPAYSPRYYAPPPIVYYSPPPATYVAPAPVYAPPPVVYDPPAVYEAPAVVYGPPVVYTAPGPYVSFGFYGRGNHHRYYRSETHYSYRR